MIEETGENNSNNWLITIRFTDKDQEKVNSQKIELIEKARERNIIIRPAWELINKLKMYKKNPSSTLKVAQDESVRLLNLPSSPQLLT